MIPVDILYIPTWCMISLIQSMDGQLKKICNYCVYKNIHTIHEEQHCMKFTTGNFFVTLRYGGNLF